MWQDCWSQQDSLQQHGLCLLSPRLPAYGQYPSDIPHSLPSYHMGLASKCQQALMQNGQNLFAETSISQREFICTELYSALGSLNGNGFTEEFRASSLWVTLFCFVHGVSVLFWWVFLEEGELLLGGLLGFFAPLLITAQETSIGYMYWTI